MEYARLPEGVVGVGSTHHFALRVESEDEQEAWRDYLREHDVDCTDVLDRGAFRSIYVRDPTATSWRSRRAGPASAPAGRPLSGPTRRRRDRTSVSSRRQRRSLRS